MVVASLLYAVCLYRAYGALDTLSPYIYYELLLILIGLVSMMRMDVYVTPTNDTNNNCHIEAIEHI